MQYWFEGMLIYMSYLMSVGNTVHPACECVIYQSYGGSSGRFTSPNFPQSYPRDTNCILYTFIGDVGEIIELTFLEFDMKQATANNICTDFLRLFLYLDSPEVNEHDRHTVELCGTLNSTQKKYYSSDRALILELHADGIPGNFSGFLGRYQFLEKNQFQITGEKMQGTQCTYRFDSNEVKSGRFFSPFYPQNYRSSSKCQYHFQARAGDTVKVFFQNIQLFHSGGSCQYSADAIVVYDGRDKSKDVIGTFCDIQNQVEVISSGRHLLIEFYSDEENEAQGFAASYQFIGTGSRSVTTPLMAPLNGVTYRPRQYGSTNEFNCNREISSKISKKGTIESPFHPKPYSAGVMCTYTFVGSGRERVSLKFVHMDLFFNGGDPKDPIDCAGSDSVKIKIKLNGESTELGSYCGEKLPPVLMSAGPQMTVEFHSEPSSTGMMTGFRAHYSFVTNFGITTGEQDRRGVCMFNYYSVKGSSGNFTSPNYPGLYPRNTECHYLFYGKGKETVDIQFPSFQVDGIGPKCDEGTHSDYVSFSNFARTEDRKLRRLCGTISDKKRQTIESDGPFFRVVFKSNHIYDDKGFFAYYQFKGIEKNNHHRTYTTGHNHVEGVVQKEPYGVKNPNSSSRHPPALHAFILMLTLTLFAHKILH